MLLGSDRDDDDDDDDGDDDIEMIFEIIPVSVCPLGTGSTVRHPTTLGTTTVPRPPHTSALGIPGEIIAADSRLGERGAWRGALPGTNHSLPGKGTDPRERRDFPTLPEPFLSRVCRHTNLNILIHTLTSR